MKTKEEIIEQLIGIKTTAGDMTPMDYGECKRCMKEYAKLLLIQKALCMGT